MGGVPVDCCRFGALPSRGQMGEGPCSDRDQPLKPQGIPQLDHAFAKWCAIIEP